MESTSPQIHRVTAEYWQALKQVRLSSLEEAPYAYGQTLEQALTIPDEEWRASCGKYAAAADNACYLAFDGDQPVGLAGAYLQEGALDTCWLWGVWVAPQYRRTGTGEALVRAAENWARSAQASHIKFWVTEANTGAAAFYQRLGYRYTGERNPETCGTCANAFLYSRKV